MNTQNYMKYIIELANQEFNGNIGYVAQLHETYANELRGC